MGDFHKVIVHHVGKMVSGHTIRFQQYLAIHLGPLDLNGTPKHIFNDANTLVGHFHSDDIRLTRCQPPLDFIFGQLRFPLFPDSAWLQFFLPG